MIRWYLLNVPPLPYVYILVIKHKLGHRMTYKSLRFKCSDTIHYIIIVWKRMVKVYSLHTRGAWITDPTCPADTVAYCPASNRESTFILGRMLYGRSRHRKLTFPPNCTVHVTHHERCVSASSRQMSLWICPSRQISWQRLSIAVSWPFPQWLVSDTGLRIWDKIQCIRIYAYIDERWFRMRQWVKISLLSTDLPHVWDCFCSFRVFTIVAFHF